MPRTALKCTVDLKLQAISCPGVWLPNKDDVYVSVCLLGQHRRTPLVSSVFPLLFYTEMDFSKVFWTSVDPTDVVERLEREHIYVELVQIDYPSTGTVLAKYETNLRDFLFPYPAIAPKILKDRDVLMEKTIDFPNGLSPRLEFSCTTHILETPTPYTDAYESATCGMDDIRIRVPRIRSYSASRPLTPPTRSHRCDQDHIGYGHRPTHDYASEEYGDDEPKRPFVVRRIDKNLIDRVPGASAPEPFPTSVNVEYRPRSTSSHRSRSRSKTRSVSSLRARSVSPARTSLTRGLYGVYDTTGAGRATTPDPTSYREPRSTSRASRRSYLDNDDLGNDDVLNESRYRYRARSPSPSPSPSPSYYERLKKQLEEESLTRRIEQRVQEALARNRYYYNYYLPSSYSSFRYRYPYSSEAMDRLSLDLERARLRRYYP